MKQHVTARGAAAGHIKRPRAAEAYAPPHDPEHSHRAHGAFQSARDRWKAVRLVRGTARQRIAGVLVTFTSACGVDGGAVGVGTKTAGTVLVTMTDFVEAEVAAVSLATGAVVRGRTALPDQDTVPARADGVPLLLSRGRGILSLQDAADPVSTIGEINVNPEGSDGSYSANPIRVVSVHETKAYVLLQATNQILIIDPTVHGDTAIQGRIDLQGLVKPNDEDQLVDVADGLKVGSRVYIGLGHYWFDGTFAQHFEGSEIVVVDSDTDALVDADPDAPEFQAIALQENNPWRGMVHDAARQQLLVGATGRSFDVLDGGIEAIDLKTLRSTGLVLTETELGEEIKGVVGLPSGAVAVQVGRALRRYDLATALSAFEVWQSDVDGFAGLGEGAAMWDGTALRVVDGFGNDVTPGGAPIDVGRLPIYAVAVLP